MVALLRHQVARERFEQRVDLEMRHAPRDRRRIDQQIRPRDLGPGAVERQPAGLHLVDHDAEREQVDAVIDRIGDRLLGSHVVRRSEHQAVRGQSALVARRVTAFAQDRDPEIDDARHFVPV